MMASEADGLVACDLSKTYAPSWPWMWRRGGRKAEGRTVLNGISFHVREGEMFGLLGPNGAGKTSLLKMVAGLSTPSSGTITLDGLATHRHAKQVQRNLGFVTCDERSFYWKLTGRQNLNFFAALYGIPVATARQRIDELLEALTLTDAAARPYASYSSGMKQKLAIARGLLGKPRLVLFDEPTRSLDPLSAARIRDWIQADARKNPQRIQILATHLLNEAEMLCDRVMILNQGSIRACGTVEQLRRSLQGGYEIHTLVYEGGAERLAQPVSERGRSGFVGMDQEGGYQEGGERSRRRVVVRAAHGSYALSEVLGGILRGGGKILECDTKVASLNEVFVSLLQPDLAAAPLPRAIEDQGAEVRS